MLSVHQKVVFLDRVKIQYLGNGRNLIISVYAISTLIFKKLN